MPPWPVIVMELGWLWTIFGFAFFAFLNRSSQHLLMALFSLFVAVGLYFRWRIGFWLSAISFAASTGGAIAQIVALHHFSQALNARIWIGVLFLVVQQAGSSLTWFRFQNPRNIRRIFWATALMVGIFAGYLFSQLFPKAT